MKKSYLVIVCFLLLSVLVVAVGPDVDDLGCCLVPDSACFPDTLESACLDQQGEFFGLQDCAEVPACQELCCCEGTNGYFVPGYSCAENNRFPGVPEAGCLAFCGGNTPPPGNGTGNGTSVTFDISGSVKTAQGEGIPFAKVYVEGFTQYFSPTDASGAYTIRDVPKNVDPGYGVRAHKIPEYALSDSIRVILDRDYADVNFVLYPPQGGSCVLPIPTLTYEEVYMAPTVHLEWAIGESNPVDCAEFLQFLVFRCDERYQNCQELPVTTPGVLDDTGLEANTQYCYKVEAKFFKDGSFVSAFSNDDGSSACPTIGDPECLIEHDPWFCMGNEMSQCQIGGEATNDLHKQDCGEDRCIIREGPPLEARCIPAQSCANCTGLFGMSSFLDPSLEIDLNMYAQCSETERTYCYLDRAIHEGTAKVVSSVPVFESCDAVERCEDYASKEACVGPSGDPCDKILGECEWKYTVPSLGMGYCTLSGDQSGACGSCADVYNDDWGCTRERCLAMDPGTCYFNENNLGRYPGLEPDQGACVAVEDMACAFYDSQADCLGAAGLPVDINVTYENAVAVDGDHRILQRSDDFFQFGKCYWDVNNSRCIKNSDDLVDPLDVQDDCGQGAQATKLCLQDVNPPETEDFLVAGQEYSIQELALGNFYTVRDQENDFAGQNPNGFARFCIYDPDGDDACYPMYPARGIEYRGSPLIPPGEYVLRYFSVDASMNLERPKESPRILLKDTGVPRLFAVYVDGERVVTPFSTMELKPDITLEFDRPVTVVAGFPVLDSGGRRFALTLRSENSAKTNFTYRPANFLSAGVYSIFVEFKSRADPDVGSQDYSQQFTVASSAMAIRAIDPKPYAGNRIISPVSVFDFVVEVSDPLATQCYAGPEPGVARPMQIVNSTARKIRSDQLQVTLPRDAGSGDSFLEGLSQVWVTCYDVGGTVSYQDFWMGVDDTLPSVALASDPALVTNYGSPYFLLGMTSDDRVVCDFSNPDPAVGGLVPLFSYDRTDFDEYVSESDPVLVSVGFIGDLPRPENTEPHTLWYDVLCTNLAGRTKNTSVRVDVDFSQVIRITVHSPDMVPDIPGADPQVWVGKNPKLNITTDIPVRSCSYAVNGGSAQSMTSWKGNSQVGFTGFAAIPSLTAEGRTNISIVCTTEPDEPGFVTSNYTFRYDGGLPAAVGIESKNLGCTPKKLSARFVANDSLSGVSNFTVALYQGTTRVFSNKGISPAGYSDQTYWVDYTYQKGGDGDVEIEEGKEYTWKVYATDKAGNPSSPVVEKKVRQNPRDDSCRVPLSIKTKSPRLGISAVSPHFELVLETNRSAECRWHLYGPRNFDEMTGEFAENKDGALSPLHTVFWDNDFERWIYVKCYDDQDFWHDTFVFVGYDPSPPVLQRFDVIPNPIIDPQKKIAQVFVESTGDKVFCECDGDSDCVSILNKTEDNYSTYLPEDLFVLNYSSYPNNYDQTLVFRYQMTCSNGADPYADSIVEKRFNGTLRLVDGVIMTLVEPGRYTNAQTTDLVVQTNIQAKCSYKKEGDSQFTRFPGEGTEFRADVGAQSEGDHRVTIECESGTKIAQQEFTYTVDRLAPANATIAALDPQCGLTSLRANVSAIDAGVGVENFTYILSMRTNELEQNIVNGSIRGSGHAELRYDGALQSNATYFWKVIAVDKAGNAGTVATEDVRVYGLDTPQCDFGKPRGSLRKWFYDQKTDVLVGCRDAESGCADQFKYNKVPLASPCSYSVVETLGRFVSLNEKVRFCYAVFDRISNNDTRSEIVQVYDVPEHCSNGVRDGNETSIDCGGECIPCVSPECGDGKVNRPGEDCDILDFGLIQGCNDGFFMGAFSGGQLKCTADCKLDTSQCVGQTGGSCRDNIINPRESCEVGLFEDVACKEVYPAAVNGTIACKSCAIDTSACKYAGVACARDSDCMSKVCDERRGECALPSCDDGVKNGDEGGVDCGGSCPDLCQVGECNDGVVNNPGEVCDGDDFGTISGCADPIFRGAFTGGVLRCTNTCRLSTTQCTGALNGTCGDGNVSAGEQCDPSSSIVASCMDLYAGAAGGDVFCSSACLLDASLCEYEGVGCSGDSDCETGWCSEGVCLVGSCDDGLINQDETDVDCGGVCPLDCEDGGGCRLNTDCKSGYCDMEISPHTCMANPDADKDGIPDKCELLWGLDPYDGADGYLDPDGDGLNNKEEYGVSLRFGRSGGCDEASDINKADTDGDGYDDGLEVERGYDPLDRNSHPPSPSEEDPINRAWDEPTPVIAIVFLIVGIVLVLGGGGYLGYSTFMLPSAARSGNVPILPAQPSAPSMGLPPKPAVPQKSAVPPKKPMTKEEFLKRRQIAKERVALKKKMRESLLDKFSDDKPVEKRPER